MGPFHINNTFGRHLGRHLNFSELPKDARVASLGFVTHYVSSFKNANLLTKKSNLEIIRVLDGSISYK